MMPNARPPKPKAHLCIRLTLIEPERPAPVDRFEIAELSDAERRELAETTLPDRIVEAQARRFCRLMPVRRQPDDDGREYLMVVLGEHDRSVVDVLPIVHVEGEPPQLGRPLKPPFEHEHRNASELFVDSLPAVLPPLEPSPEWLLPPHERSRRRRRRYYYE